MVVMDMDVLDTKTKTKTNTMCFKDPMYAIFLKSRGFKDFKKVPQRPGICYIF